MGRSEVQGLEKEQWNTKGGVWWISDSGVKEEGKRLNHSHEWEGSQESERYKVKKDGITLGAQLKPSHLTLAKSGQSWLFKGSLTSGYLPFVDSSNSCRIISNIAL